MIPTKPSGYSVPDALSEQDSMEREILNRYYGYKSLFEFKKKYQPVWQGRYLGFLPNANLILIALALVRVHLPKGLVRILRS